MCLTTTRGESTAGLGFALCRLLLGTAARGTCTWARTGIRRGRHFHWPVRTLRVGLSQLGAQLARRPGGLQPRRLLFAQRRQSTITAISARYNRGVFEHAGRGVPANFHPAATREGFARPAGGVNHAAANHAGPAARPSNAFSSRPLAHSPAAAAHAQAAHAQAARPAAHAQASHAGGGGGGHPSGGGGHPAAHAAPAHAAPAHAAAHGGGEHHK